MRTTYQLRTAQFLRDCQACSGCKIIFSFITEQLLVLAILYKMPTSKNVKVVAKVDPKPPAAAFKTHWQKYKEDPNTGAESTDSDAPAAKRIRKPSKRKQEMDEQEKAQKKNLLKLRKCKR
jgi:hypothetical protein